MRRVLVSHMAASRIQIRDFRALIGRWSCGRWTGCVYFPGALRRMDSSLLKRQQGAVWRRGETEMPQLALAGGQVAGAVLRAARRAQLVQQHNRELASAPDFLLITFRPDVCMQRHRRPRMESTRGLGRRCSLPGT
jgi:hypothetical protein